MSATCSTVTDIKAVVTCWYVNTDDDTTVLFYSIYEQHASLLKQARLQISCLSAAAASLDTAWEARLTQPVWLPLPVNM